MSNSIQTPSPALTQAAADYALIAQAIAYLEANYQAQPDLAAVAAQVGLSESHFQRLFSRWAGISPKRFVQYLTASHAKALLQRTENVLDAAYAAGLSGPGRLHDLLVNLEAMTPGQVKQRGAGLTIRTGVHPSPFGPALIGVTERGVCWLSFEADGEEGRELRELKESWAGANVVADQTGTAPIAAQIFTPSPPHPLTPSPLHLYVRGTNFQVKVWEALLRIPAGGAVSYGDVARWIGKPGASRAVGSAVGANLISYLIPCHRVLRSSGVVGDYRWGHTRKQAILAWESAHAGWDGD
ncbi:MAG: methylated-DNA--[protein]-cysteine S-methyltransferase [Caldilineaceae bacterium]|nr:methylated-DNA--[protein]-cysteine S-methyltransferase [Caldilineaceae bacterium]MBP8109817.1 methylated-DNA--[protein]-cysteine S-methyltransferase [Caldilineaceae bacterium]MBP8124742.1 methylated-DNA--[protein]-cysteine S-methyltransferase [Caldilineaceae bacterium]MBP9073963.1 methylated-DNA--[protein]-cysteine S-methyltransferase [Caldilineaceae bacterium]